MKKISVLMILCLAFAMIMAGCGGSGDNTDAAGMPDNQLADGTPDASATNLEGPVMEWWEVYNPNGFDTFTALIYNPNDVPVDFGYDLVFYKNGTEVGRIDYCSNICVKPDYYDVIWANYDVPPTGDVDEVRLENLTVADTFYTPISGSYEYKGIVNDQPCYEFTFDSKPELATITTVEYIDNNGNGKFDKGEIVSSGFYYLTEKTGEIYLDGYALGTSQFDLYYNAN